MGETGIFTPILKHFLEATLDGEMSNHRSSEKLQTKSNRRNGHNNKEVRSGFGSFELDTTKIGLVVMSLSLFPNVRPS